MILVNVTTEIFYHCSHSKVYTVHADSLKYKQKLLLIDDKGVHCTRLKRRMIFLSIYMRVCTKDTISVNIEREINTEVPLLVDMFVNYVRPQGTRNSIE